MSWVHPLAPVGPPASGRKAILLNQYTGITDCYDLLMRGGYYDHDTMAGAADAVMGDRKKVLELGVGTGLFAQSLAGRKPKKAKRSVGSPARVRAAIAALGPGMVVTLMPAARASRTSL